jgi:hypothetical protein
MVLDKETREKLRSIIKANPVGGLFVTILMVIIPSLIYTVQEFNFKSPRDFGIVFTYMFIIIVSVSVIIFTTGKTNERVMKYLENDRNHEQFNQKMDMEIKIRNDEIKYKHELDKFAMTTYEEQKKYQLFLLANQSNSYYEELLYIVSNIIFIIDSLTMDLDQSILSRELERFRDRMRLITTEIRNLPKQIEMTFKEFILQKTGDITRQEYLTVTEEILEIAKKISGKSDIQTERPIPTPPEIKKVSTIPSNSNTNEFDVFFNNLKSPIKDA